MASDDAPAAGAHAHRLAVDDGSDGTWRCSVCDAAANPVDGDACGDCMAPRETLPHDAATQRKLMARAIEIAAEARAAGNHPFGALLASPSGDILLEAENNVNTAKDSTGHAETNLMRKASAELTDEQRSTAIMYTSTEPCVMCCGAVYWTGVRCVVYACSHEDLGRIAGPSLLMSAAQVFAKGHEKVTVLGPLLNDEGIKAHDGYWT